MLSLNAWRASGVQTDRGEVGNLWDPKCVCENSYFNLNLHPAEPPTPPPPCTHTHCSFHSFSFLFTIHSFSVHHLSVSFHRSHIQVLCYRTPWGLTHCLTLLNAFCVRRVANASYFPMKWPFNSSPGHTGSMWRLLTLWSLASECWRTWKLTLLRREFASSVKNNIWFNSFLCEGEVQNIWWPHNNMIFTAMCCLWSIRLSHYSNSWLRFREHKIRTIIYGRLKNVLVFFGKWIIMKLQVGCGEIYELITLHDTIQL